MTFSLLVHLQPQLLLHPHKVLLECQLVLLRPCYIPPVTMWPRVTFTLADTSFTPITPLSPFGISPFTYSSHSPFPFTVMHSQATLTMLTSGILHFVTGSSTFVAPFSSITTNTWPSSSTMTVCSVAPPSVTTSTIPGVSSSPSWPPEFSPSLSISSPLPQTLPGPVSLQHQVKLPRLTLKRFNRNITKCIAFWDSFNSAVNSNPSLSNVDKFTYLHFLLDASAAVAIVGLTLSSANYEEAVATLKQRFGNP